MSHPPRSVVVVGAGLAGMTAALTAADHGAQVTVLEARGHVGGRARTATTTEGFRFNQGAHALYRGGAAWEVLTGFGITPRGSSPEAARAYGVLRDGTLHALPGSFAGLLRTRVLGGLGKLEVVRTLARPERICDTVSRGTSVQEWIDARSRRADVRAVLGLLARISTYCGDLDALDAAAGVAQMVQAFTHGVVYLDDGWQQLVDQLQELAPARRVTVRTTAKVDAIQVAADGVVVRTADRCEVAADAVVLASGGPRDADVMLDGASAAVHRWSTDERPVVATTLDIALRALPVPERRIACGLDEPTYFSVHTPYGRVAHGDAGEVAHLLWYGEADGDPRAGLEWLLDRVQPGWHAQLADWRHGRRLVVAHGRPLPGRGLAGRPPSVVPDLANVYVAGDWVGPDGLLADAAFASGRAAGRAAATARTVVTT